MSVVSELFSWLTSFSARVGKAFRRAFNLARSESSRLGDAAKSKFALAESNDDGNRLRGQGKAVVDRVSFAPENECVYAIGDIHGRLDLLMSLLERIEADIEALPPQVRVKLVFLGDYIDRGLNSKQVIEYFLSGALDQYNPVFLMGNHESAMLRFLEDANFGETWASYGGVETLYSYGFQVPAGSAALGGNTEEAWHALWNRFRSELPADHLTFYKQLEPYHIAGDYVFVHAGLKPGVPIENQSTDDLYWIRDEFLSNPRLFEKVVVHGHTPSDEIFRDNRRIGLDTGAYITGCLSAGRFFKDEVKFIST